MLPPGRGKVGGWTTTQAETRYGCFLPDLTGLARDLSTASLPERLYQGARPRRQAHRPRASSKNLPRISSSKPSRHRRPRPSATDLRCCGVHFVNIWLWHSDTFGGVAYGSEHHCRI